MRLVWTDQRRASEVAQTLTERGFEPEQLGLSGRSAACRITRPFPVFVDARGHFVQEAFDFLFDVAFVRGSTRSPRTLETYAESLLSWLAFAERRQLVWRKPTSSMLATYRDHMLGTVSDSIERRVRPLARTTVNLRLTVAIEFYKYLGCIGRVADLCPPSMEERYRSAGATGRLRLRVQASELERLKVRIYARRAKALSADHCRALCHELRNPYRLIYQWQLCTGLRIGSVVHITLAAFKGTQAKRFQPPLSVVAKGGKVASVHVPVALRLATLVYIAVDRELALARSGAKTDELLFLNTLGRPVTAKGFYRALRKRAQRLGIRTHPHQSRTTFATYIRDKLEQMEHEGRALDSVKIVQSLLDHATAETTERYLESIDVPSVDVLRVLEELAGMVVAQEPA